MAASRVRNNTHAAGSCEARMDCLRGGVLRILESDGFRGGREESYLRLEGRWMGRWDR
jgi:hypothetical protein